MIKHVLSDGRELESIEGFVVPPIGATEVVYRILAEYMQNVCDTQPEIIQEGGIDH